MATEDGEDAQRAEEVGLKRKLTGPPRPKTDHVNGPVLKTAATDLTAIPIMGEEDRGCRRRPEVKGEHGDGAHREASRPRWWRRFSSAVGCTRRQKNEEKRIPVQTSVSREQPSLNFHKKFRRFFARAGSSSWSAPSPREAQQDEQTEPQREEALGPDGDVQNTATDASSEAAMVSAELKITAKGPEEPSTELHNTADGSRMTQTVTASSAHVGLTLKAESEDEGFTTEDALDSAASERHDENSNGPSIRIELVPPDNTGSQEAEDGEGSLSQNQNHHLLLLGFDYSEQKLLRTALSLVRAAMSAAVDQLSKEHQNGSERVHREAQGCRDHA